MSRAGKITRRVFLGAAGAAAAGLAVGYYVYRRPFPNPLEAQAGEGEAVFNPFVKIPTEGPITVIVPRAEMGQGVTTTLAALIAEELDVRLDQVTVEHGPAASAYANIGMLEEGVPFPRFDDSTIAEMMRGGMGVVGRFLAMQATGGSSSTTDGFTRMRQAGALAREALKAQAARRWQVDAASLTTAEGFVTNPATGETVAYGELALDAARVDLTADPILRDPAEWKLLGRPQPRLDMEAKVTGAPIFGVDVDLPDMVFATIRMNPHFGGTIRTLDDAGSLAMPGVEKLVIIETHLGNGFGVIARSTWHAMRAADAVQVEWERPDRAVDDDAIWAGLEAAVAGRGSNFRDDGDVETVFADAPRERMVEAEYRVPFLAHAAMEPMNATARFRDGELDVWAPNQSPTLTRMACAREAGISQENCRVHTTSLGGAFGRRLEVDYAVYATRLAMETNGRPVKVTWTREEDMTHDMYRPAAMGRFRARLGEDGMPQALDMKIASPSIIASLLPRLYPRLPVPGSDTAIVDGSFNQPYSIANYRVSGVVADNPGVPVGFWRAVGNSFNGFFHEAFMDEIATAGGIDPVELRLSLMADHPAAVGVVEKVADMAEWSASLPANRAKGFAFATSFGSWVAEIVEISETEGRIRLEKVWIAADVGRALDPSIIEAQLMSGALFGLSAAMFEEVNFADGRAVQTNFHDYDPLRIHQSPDVEVAILQNAPKMGGVGEIGTPPAAPALANAIFALTGKRIRQLPLAREVDFA
ncbi:molybdopterin-dependent oxidoreductase [Aliihoeflea aestuarii]|uniref:xanthine dehydrogenase family protein molybdopterin-binding subunit n=1 Tax=Aliihoeflea aestuarii TaxID=453840 RepID=UPI0020931CFE|nr:molybdopterin cofactor-binding domain-containing protein [Aliihoeflea aestuarii]MCO6391222.1 molybdopterin-dependent oxidoreductase [Aliihoeflea aestuarii]